MTLTLDEIAHLLAVERRRAVISALADDSPRRVATLADEIADENRSSTYTALYQSHIPKLVEAGVLEYSDRKVEVARGACFDEARTAMSALEDAVDQDPRIVPDGGREWIACDLCGAQYRSQAAALRCCDERFDDDDLDDRAAMTAVDEHGSPTILTDGGQPRPDDYQIPTIEELDRMRVAADLNQRDLSRRAGMEPKRFNHILHNDTDPHVSTLRAFLRALRDATDEEIIEEPEHGPDPSPSPNAGRKRCWDDDACPREDCDGRLQQVDRLNVACLECEQGWSHIKTDDEHRLVDAESEIVARKPRMMADGGFRSTEDEWSRRITSEGGINELVTDLEVGLHNMWVDIRSQNDVGEFEPVTVDVTVSVTGGAPTATDGGQPTDAEDIEHHAEGFVSQAHLMDEHSPEPRPEREPICTERNCTERGLDYCDCCGRHLCGRHNETQAGFCSDFTQIATGEFGEIPCCPRVLPDGEPIVDANPKLIYPAETDAEERAQQAAHSELQAAVRDRMPDWQVERARELLGEVCEAIDAERALAVHCETAATELRAWSRAHEDRRADLQLARAAERLTVATDCLDEDDLGHAWEVQEAKALVADAVAITGGDEA